ncbi:O-succinylhomoserine sulfhydrylase [Luminiphilus sp.]|nr:O-succinylhomoserine sulfhydrylase [Luminiphilus sp.]MDA8985592.1 O-succinylhomoserine sulfhydrylase [Luminiphilus sp.]MDB2644597.1 O-succinylhomoserine sulfhydrylase [Luminiphilus sp.]MDB4048635.1 O-succinylhomoserine sulfhydrylase [Luminiphilus sp.]
MTDDSGDWLSSAGSRTQAVRAGIRRTHEAEHGEPIFASSSFLFASAEEAEAKFSGELAGNVYSRYTNPTVRGFEERLSALEQGEVAAATASGMSAILALCMTHLRAGDHVLCSQDVFGATVGLFDKVLKKFGVEVTFVSLTRVDDWREAATPQTRLLFLETPSNPLNAIADLPAFAQLSRDLDAILAVDNCFCTPALQNPLALGADIVTHSATKYLDGQGRVLGGALVGSEALIAPVVAFNRSCGPTMSAFNAWIMLKGLETLDLRMRAHCLNAQRLAEWLVEQPGVEQVHYCGLPNHPGHALAASQQRGFGGVIAFEITGGREAAWRFINHTQLMSLTANLGDAKTTIIHPATTTHGRLTERQRSAAGIHEGLIRIAVGLEDVEDLQADCLKGFSAAQHRR